MESHPSSANFWWRAFSVKSGIPSQLISLVCDMAWAHSLDAHTDKLKLSREFWSFVVSFTFHHGLHHQEQCTSPYVLPALTNEVRKTSNEYHGVANNFRTLNVEVW